MNNPTPLTPSQITDLLNWMCERDISPVVIQAQGQWVRKACVDWIEAQLRQVLILAPINGKVAHRHQEAPMPPLLRNLVPQRVFL